MALVHYCHKVNRIGCHKCTGRYFQGGVSYYSVPKVVCSCLPRSFSLLAEPQAILETPSVSDITDTSATITWTEADGDVDQYFIQYTHLLDNVVSNASVGGSQLTSVMVTGLQQLTRYSVVVFTVNTNGLSRPSPVVFFTTISKFFLLVYNTETCRLEIACYFEGKEQ